MRKVLVADDNPGSRELVREVLLPRSYEVLEARDGREALERIRQSSPDLVLLDIQMPVLDGFGVLRELRRDQRFAGLPVMAITAYAMQGDREKALAAGFDAYLTKPIKAATLRKEVEKLFQRGPAERV